MVRWKLFIARASRTIVLGASERRKENGQHPNFCNHDIKQTPLLGIVSDSSLSRVPLISELGLPQHNTTD